MNKFFWYSLTIASFSLFVSFIFTQNVEAATYTPVQYETRYDGKYYLATQTLTKDKSPYFILGGCAAGSLPDYATLTIEAGVVIKFDIPKYCSGSTVWSGLIVRGNLFVNGTSAEPVVFTSFFDDDGGDTNGDSTATFPKKGDWDGVVLFPGVGSDVKITNALFKYGGQKTSELYIGKVNNSINVTLQNLEFASSSGYGFGSAMPVTIGNSIFHNNRLGAISADLFWNPQIIAVNNWWGDDSGPTVWSNPEGRGERISGNVLYDPWVGKNSPPEIGQTTVTEVSFLPEQPTFEAVYSDVNNNAPTEISVVVNSTTYPMLPTTCTNNHVSGTVYSFVAPTGTFDKGEFKYHFEVSDGSKSVRYPKDYELSFKVKHIPVILIPGIAGTELKDENGDLLWLNLGKMIIDRGDEFLDKLEMDNDGVSKYNVQVSDVIRVKGWSKFTFNYFEKLIGDLKSKNYAENEDLFVFPYDWRLSNKVNSQKLSSIIQKVIGSAGSGQAKLVTHSMGGLLAKQYLRDYGPSLVERLIFVGTPHLGSPDAFKTLLSGSDFGIPVLNAEEIKKLALNMPSVYELLPTAKYINEFGSYFKNGNTDYDVSGTANYLIDNGSKQILLDQAQVFHNSGIDDFTVKVKMFNIVGCDAATLGKVMHRKVMQNSGAIKDDYNIIQVPGDGTVPLMSATAVPVDDVNTYYVSKAVHSKMPSQDGIRQLITGLIDDAVPNDLEKNIRKNTSNCYLNGKLISVHSPVSLSVYDTNGNHLGPNSDGGIDRDIEGASYEQIGKEKFVFVPDDIGVYSVKILALATGTFDFKVQEVVSSNTQTTTNYFDIAITASSSAEIKFDTTDLDPVLRLDPNGDGKSIEIIPSSVLGSAGFDDFEAPSSSIVFSGLAGKDGWFRSVVSVAISAVDDKSGILTTEYSIDNGTNWLNYSGQFVIDTEGVNKILYRSIDKAGNKEEIREGEVKVDTKAPEFVLSFSTSTGDIDIISVERPVTFGQNSFEVVDQAGNTTRVWFSRKISKESIKYILVGISYNGKIVSLKTNLNFEFKKKKNGEITKLEQEINVRRHYEIGAKYEKRNGITKIEVVDEKKRSKLKKEGLVILKISSNNGVLNINY